MLKNSSIKQRLPKKIEKSLIEVEEGCDECEGGGEQISILSLLGQPQKNSLDDRGILLLNSPIDKRSVSYIIYRLWSSHFDENNTEDIQLILNSPGGEASAGWALIDTMASIKNRVITVAVGEIASMATFIFIAGDERVMSPNSSAMIHQFSTWSMGSYGDLVASRKGEDMEWDREVRHLIQYSKYESEAQVKANLLMDHDLWLTPSEMKKHGLCDRISKPRKKVEKKKG